MLRIFKIWSLPCKHGKLIYQCTLKVTCYMEHICIHVIINTVKIITRYNRLYEHSLTLLLYCLAIRFYFVIVCGLYKWQRCSAGFLFYFFIQFLCMYSHWRFIYQEGLSIGLTTPHLNLSQLASMTVYRYAISLSQMTINIFSLS